LDDLTVTDNAPAWHVDRPELPPAKEGMVFRFAAVQDPQIGFHKADHDLWAVGRAVEQINAAGVEMTLFMGDMTHKNDDEESARALKGILDGLKGRWLAARGNHDDEAIFTRHFAPALDYAVEHKGVRFVVFNAVGNETPLADGQLAWIEGEFKKAKAAGQMIVVASHCSPWDENERGRAKYNRIGDGKDRLKTLMKEHGIALSLAGHYHRGAWHAEADGTHYVVPAGTCMMRAGPTGFCLFDVYPDRIEVFVKQLVVPYDDEKAAEFFHLPYGVWAEYAPFREKAPCLMQGPVVIPRR
jgi:predicted phosphodiesterase